METNPNPTVFRITIPPQGEPTPKQRRSWLIIAFVLSAAAPFFPFIGFVLPAVWTWAALINRGAFLAPFALLTTALCFFFGGTMQNALLNIALIVPSGIVLYFLHRFKFNNFYCVFFTAVVITLGLFGSICGPSLLEGREPMAQTKDIILQVASLVPQEAATEVNLSEYVHQLNNTIDEVYLGMLFAMGAAMGLSNGLLVHLFDRKLKTRQLSLLPPFALWMTTPSFAVGSMILAFLALILPSLGVKNVDTLWPLAQLVWLLPMAFSGWTMIYCFCSFRIKPFIIATVIILVLLPFTLTLLAMLGTASVLFIRKKVST